MRLHGSTLTEFLPSRFFLLSFSSGALRQASQQPLRQLREAYLYFTPRSSWASLPCASLIIRVISLMQATLVYVTTPYYSHEFDTAVQHPGASFSVPDDDRATKKRERERERKRVHQRNLNRNSWRQRCENDIRSYANQPRKPMDARRG